METPVQKVFKIHYDPFRLNLLQLLLVQSLGGKLQGSFLKL